MKKNKEQKLKSLESHLTNWEAQLKFQIKMSLDETPYNKKPLNQLNSNEKRIRFGRQKRIDKIVRRVKNIQKLIKTCREE